ncbi:hypothetical protein ACQ4PT_005493 [Festuca glaucescens]
MLHDAAPCTCGLLYGSCGGGCSMLQFGDHHHYYGGKQCGDQQGFGVPFGGSVDCTLSLGTPSTRRAAEAGGARAPAAPGGQQQANAGGARRCANCDTTSTPLWRNGPRGPKSLCNACGIRYKKEERRAAAAAVAPTAMASDSGMEYAYGYARQQQQQPQQWGCYGPAVAKAAASYGMFGDAAQEDGPCLPWGLGVMPSSPAFGSVREMTSLFHYY